MNKNSNKYIIMYSVVMVVIVATMLAVTAQLLQPIQYENVLNEKKDAILASLNAQDQNYNDYITAYAVDAEGNKIESITADYVISTLMSDLGAAVKAKTFPVFQAKDGRIVVPVIGAGLWGPIWGYVALDKDLNTVVGAVLDHKGETPGLGAEIANAKFQTRFVGKQIFNNGVYMGITLVKGGAMESDANYINQVDGISGGTRTADGVSAMLIGSLKNYLPLLEKLSVCEDECCKSNVEKSECNE